MSLLQYLERFHLLYVLEESEVVAQKNSFKKVFLQIPQNVGKTQ